MQNNTKQELIKTLKEGDLRLGEPMSRHTTFGIGGPAEVFYVAKSADKLVKAVKLACKLKIPYFVFGSSSNILVSDKGIRGLVIKNQAANYKLLSADIFAESGVLLSKLVELATNNSLTGLEILTGIPGTLGGAIVGNAGTKQGFISQVVEKVTVLGKDNKIYSLENNECQFDYRLSRFKKTGEIILNAVLILKKGKREKIREKIKQALEERKDQPKGKNAGCIFKNPPLCQGFAGLDRSAGYLIENAGFKGKRIGGAMVSEKHANWIINTGKATCSDVLELTSLVKEKVWKEFKVKLEEEVVVIGEL